MDAEAYSEVSKNVLQILWNIGTSRHPGHDSKWERARTSAFEALIQYEVIFMNSCSNIPPFLLLDAFNDWTTENHAVCWSCYLISLQLNFSCFFTLPS